MALPLGLLSEGTLGRFTRHVGMALHRLTAREAFGDPKALEPGIWRRHEELGHTCSLLPEAKARPQDVADAVFIIQGEPTTEFDLVKKKSITSYKQVLLTQHPKLQRYLKFRSNHPLPPSVDIGSMDAGWDAWASVYDSTP